jgi:hypothetical protein
MTKTDDWFKVKIMVIMAVAVARECVTFSNINW